MSGKRIILVDDEAYVTMTLATKFRRLGHQVTTACNGEEGFLLASAEPPDLLITDYQMPVLTGYEMSMKLAAQPSTAQVPVLMLTARGHHLSPEQLARTSIRCLFAKPFSAREVIATAQHILGLAGGGADGTIVSQAGANRSVGAMGEGNAA